MAQVAHTRRRQEGAPSPVSPDISLEHHDTLNVSSGFIWVFVVMMCVALITLYLLYDYLGTHHAPRVSRASKALGAVSGAVER